MTSSCRIHLSTGPGRSPSRNYSQWGRKSKEDAILDEQLARAPFNCWSLSDLVRWLREPRQAVADEMAPEYCLGTGCPVPPKELQPEDPYVLSVCLQHSCPNVCEPRPELGIRNDCSLSARNRACSAAAGSFACQESAIRFNSSDVRSRSQICAERSAAAGIICLLQQNHRTLAITNRGQVVNREQTADHGRGSSLQQRSS
jgi:hypothetical protein